jgi:uncharacterized protein YfaP (DUF2135 family)
MVCWMLQREPTAVVRASDSAPFFFSQQASAAAAVTAARQEELPVPLAGWDKQGRTEQMYGTCWIISPNDPVALSMQQAQSTQIRHRGGRMWLYGEAQQRGMPE